MKGDTVLDYLELHLAPCRTRCDLYVSADGVTEKLASGFVKPFVTHLRAVEEKIERGCQAIRLERPATSKDQRSRSWFTKGTSERFVRFVSTPEVLERVKTIEDELVQLEQVRNIQASSLLQAEDVYLGADPTLSRSDRKTISGFSQEKNGTSNAPRRYQYDATDGTAEGSKRSLLRAMDVRLLALRQEQSMAFGRATGAGFDSANIADLIAFAKYFGAERLCVACIQFLALSRKRQGEHPEPIELDIQAAQSGLDMPSSVNGPDYIKETKMDVNMKAAHSENTLSNMQKGSYDPEGARKSALADARTKLIDGGTRSSNNPLSGDQGVTEARRWGPPESFRSKPCVVQDENFASFEETSRGVSQNDYSNGHRYREYGQDECGAKESKHDEVAPSNIHRLGTNDLEIRSLSSTGLRTKDGIRVNSGPPVFLPERNTNSEQPNSRISETTFKYYREDSEGTSAVGASRDNIQLTSLVSSDIDVAKSKANEAEFNSSNCQETHSASPSQQSASAEHSPEGHSVSQADVSRCVPQRSTSPKRRSASPLRRVQIGRSGARRTGSVVIRSINYFSSQERSNKEKNSNTESNSSDSEDNNNDDHPDEIALVPTSSPAPTRRLSVQAAISLFENKQRRDSIEAPVKQRPVKQKSSTGSLEVSNSASSGRVIPRRWSESNDNEVSSICKKMTTSDKQENKVACQALDTERFASEAAGLSVMNSQPSKTSREIQDRQLSDRLHKEASIKSSDGASANEFQEASYQCAADTSSASAEVGAAPEKRLSSNEQQKVSGDLHDAFRGDWRENFKLQLERSLTREAVRSDLSSTGGNGKSESDIMDPSTLGKSKSLKSDHERQGESAPFIMNNSTVTTDAEKGSLASDFRKHLPMENNSAVTTSHTATEGRVNQGPSHPGPNKFPVEAGQSSRTKGHSSKVKKSKINTELDIRGNQDSVRESLGSSSIAPSTFDTQAPAEIVDSQNGDDDSSGGQKGRFYEHYRQLRDAKLMEEHDTKRMEREAKLRSMEETLEKRKAEMDARTAKLSRQSNHGQTRAAKLQALKAGVYITKNEQEENDADGQSGIENRVLLQAKDQRNPNSSSPTSPPLTPRATKERAPAPKLHVVKKSAAAPQKTTTTPRSSTRAATSVSPKSTPRSTVGAPSIQRRSGISSVVDNPLARSVPCFADLRKENTKPALGRSSGSVRAPLKNGGGPGRLRAVNEVNPLEANVNASIQNASRNGPAKADKKRRSMLMRKSCATANELKALSTSGDEGILVPLKGQREATCEPVIYSKLRRSAVAPIQEVKPFLRKGRGIGPGAGPGVMKLKSSCVADAAKSSDEDAPTTPTGTAQVLDTDYQIREDVMDAVNPDASVLENVEREAGTEAGTEIGDDALLTIGDDALSTVAATHCSDDATFSLPEDPEEKSELTTLDPSPEDTFDHESAFHTISFPIDFETQKRYAVSCSAELDSNPQSFGEASCQKREESAPLAHLLAEDATESFQTESVVTDSTQAQVSSLPFEHIAPTFSPAAASPSCSTVARPGTVSDHFSPSSIVALESPLESPASWNSSQIQYASEADLARTHKKWGASHKPSHKEPAKGFKRLLNFARKGRASEVASADCVSASTTSEGDDDSEEPRDVSNRSADDLLRRARLQEKSSKAFGNAAERYNTHEQGFIQSLQSSIPTPPANFKLRDDHLSGGTLLKAPRSFFSLSTFRSRGSEGKSR